MPDYAILQVDAFTTRPLAGNPCAVVLDADDLDAATMLAVAREMNLSETAFVTASDVADVGARYFTPVEEIPLAGHPTIATVQALLDAGRLRVDGRPVRFSIELVEGPIDVEVRPDGDDGPPTIVMTQRVPRFLRTYDGAEVAPVFGLRPSDLLDAPVQTVSTGTPQLMVPVGDLDALRGAALDVAAYRALKARSDFFSPHLFCLEGATPAGHTFARHFGVPPDTPEDPFTGSATGGMAAYLWRHGLIESPTFTAEQGHWMARPGRARVEVDGPRDAIEAVRVGGRAVTVLRGTLSP